MEGKKLLRTLVWLVALGVIIVGLTMCTGTSPGPGATDAPVAVEPTQAAAAPPTAEPTETSTPELTEAAATETPTAEPTAEPTETPTVEPTEEPTEEPTGAPAVDVASLSSQNCVNCHTVQETLQALAEEKGVKSEASSGEG